MVWSTSGLNLLSWFTLSSKESRNVKTTSIVYLSAYSCLRFFLWFQTAFSRQRFYSGCHRIGDAVLPSSQPMARPPIRLWLTQSAPRPSWFSCCMVAAFWTSRSISRAKSPMWRRSAALLRVLWDSTILPWWDMLLSSWCPVSASVRRLLVCCLGELRFLGMTLGVNTVRFAFTY